MYAVKERGGVAAFLLCGHGELLAVIAMPAQTNALVTGLQTPVDDQFKAQQRGGRKKIRRIFLGQRGDCGTFPRYLTVRSSSTSDPSYTPNTIPLRRAAPRAVSMSWSDRVTR